MFGAHLHATGALGAHALLEWAQEMAEDVTWGLPRPANSASRQHDGAGAAAAATNTGGGEMQPSAESSSARLWEPPRGYQPGILQVSKGIGASACVANTQALTARLLRVRVRTRSAAAADRLWQQQASAQAAVAALISLSTVDPRYTCHNLCLV